MTFLQNRGIVRYVSAADSQQERSVFYIGKKRGKEKMTFYQELQLSSVGSKQLIKNTTDKKEKRRHILIYNFKVYLVMAFCVVGDCMCQFDREVVCVVNLRSVKYSVQITAYREWLCCWQYLCSGRQISGCVPVMGCSVLREFLGF